MLDKKFETTCATTTSSLSQHQMRERRSPYGTQTTPNTYFCMTRWKNWKADKFVNDAETTKLCVIRGGIVFFSLSQLWMLLCKHFCPSKFAVLCSFRINGINNQQTLELNI